MPHGIDQTVNARGAFVSNRVPAWHSLGDVFDGLTMAQILEYPGISFRVDLEFLVTESGRAVPDQFATVRSDTKVPLAVVGDRYQIIQHTDEFRAFDDVLTPAGYVYETAGVLKGGREVFLLAKRPEGVEIVSGDALKEYLLFRFSYDGKSKTRAKMVSERVVCNNTLAIGLAESGGFDASIRHTASGKAKLDDVRATIAQASQAFERHVAEAKAMAMLPALPADSRFALSATIETALGTAPEETKALSRYRETVEEILSAIGSNLGNPRQNIPGMEGSKWALYNAISEWADHDFANGSRGTERARAERRFSSALDGPANDVKQAAWKSLSGSPDVLLEQAFSNVVSISR